MAWSVSPYLRSPKRDSRTLLRSHSRTSWSFLCSLTVASSSRSARFVCRFKASTLFLECPGIAVTTPCSTRANDAWSFPMTGVVTRSLLAPSSPRSDVARPPARRACRRRLRRPQFLRRQRRRVCVACDHRHRPTCSRSGRRPCQGSKFSRPNSGAGRAAPGRSTTQIPRCSTSGWGRRARHSPARLSTPTCHCTQSISRPTTPRAWRPSTPPYPRGSRRSLQSSTRNSKAFPTLCLLSMKTCCKSCI